jgi:transketolase
MSQQDRCRLTDSQHLKDRAKNIRIDIIKSLASAGSGHLGGSLGLADVFSALYFRVMNHKPDDPKWIDRDRLILSIGHVAPVLYTTLAHAGYFPVEELLTLRKLGSRLQGHPGVEHGLPGLELSAGSLGQGLSVAVGMAISAKLSKRKNRVFTILGDGELQEGSVWEAAMSASHYKLNNLVAVVDRNYVQIDGTTEDVMALEPLADKWRSFGWNTLTCNGNSIDELCNVFDEALQSGEKPTVILANTKMGRGVPEIENDNGWHGKAPNQEQAEYFIREITGGDNEL